MEKNTRSIRVYTVKYNLLNTILLFHLRGWRVLTLGKIKKRKAEGHLKERNEGKHRTEKRENR